MDATSTFDFGGLSGAALGQAVGLLVGVVLLIVVAALALRWAAAHGPAAATDPAPETAAA
jgi:hypothetical protein